MKHAFRWFGLKDPTTLQDISQAGATDIVSALHDIPTGEVWSYEKILQYKNYINNANLNWSVVESLPVHDDIKRRSGNYKEYIKHYKLSLANLAKANIKTICYNFMPILDWTRTDLKYRLPNGALALRFDEIAFAAFELFILKRQHAESDYSSETCHQAKQYYEKMSAQDIDNLTNTIIAGLPGSEDHYTLAEFSDLLKQYQDISADTLRHNLKYFLNDIMDVLQENDMKMAIHPDDPPRPILGLPRIVSTERDIDWLLNEVPQHNNGLTFCTGSYGVREDNDLKAMATKFASRIYFAHLRSTQRETNNSRSFYEADHLQGNGNIIEIVHTLLVEEKHRKSKSDDWQIPIRPDHGHQILDDIDKTNLNPGYSTLGRMKGLAEIRGVEQTLLKYVIK